MGKARTTTYTKPYSIRFSWNISVVYRWNVDPGNPFNGDGSQAIMSQNQTIL